MREIIFLNEGTAAFDNLNEDVLLEGKILNTIRWRLAKFTLRFLKESAIDEFLKAYYTDKDGKLAPKGKEWLTKSKKEKIKKMRELADNLPDSDKQKVIESKDAKQLEKAAVKSGIISGLAIGATALSAIGRDQSSELAHDAQKNTGEKTDPTIEKVNYEKIQYSDGRYRDEAGTMHYPDGSYTTASGKHYTAQEVANTEKIAQTGNLISNIAGFLLKVMNVAFITSIATSAIGLARSGISAHKANVVRREEIMKELLAGKKNLKEDVELIAVDYLINLLG